MASWLIVSDSCCEIRTLENPAPGVSFAVVPFKIRVGSREFTDTSMLNVSEMMAAMDNYNGASTSACPSPEEYAQAYLQADNVICLTISQNLSGSYNAACVARDMVLEEYPDKHIAVVDLFSCGGELAATIWKINEWIGQGLSFAEVVEKAREYGNETHLMFLLASFENLAKNGRVNRVVGFIAGKLNMRVLGRATNTGSIEFFFKTRGESRGLARILEEMQAMDYHGQRTVVISHCNNAEGAHLLEHGIHELWPDAPVAILPCAGLTSFYAQDRGMIVSY